MQRTVFAPKIGLWIALVFAVCLSCAWSLAAGTKDQGIVLAETDTLYHHVTIRQYEDQGHRIRCMVFAGKSPTNQSCIDLEDPTRQVLEYSEMAFASLLFQPNPRKVLVIGLGGGVIPGIYAKLFPYARVDVVEIDPKVVEFAKKYFNFKTGDKTTVIVQDGRRYVRQSKQRYDVILLDAYNGDQIPFHLMTREFFEEIKAHALEDKGILVSNVWSSTQLFLRQMATYQACFKGVYPFLGDRSGNVMVVATHQKGSPATGVLVERGKKMQDEHKYPFFDLGKVAGLFSPTLVSEEKEQILTDDYAPVNYLLKKK